MGVPRTGDGLERAPTRALAQCQRQRASTSLVDDIGAHDVWQAIEVACIEHCWCDVDSCVVVTQLQALRIAQKVPPRFVWLVAGRIGTLLTRDACGLFDEVAEERRVVSVGPVAA